MGSDLDRKGWIVDAREAEFRRLARLDIEEALAKAGGARTFLRRDWIDYYFEILAEMEAEGVVAKISDTPRGTTYRFLCQPSE